MCLLDLTHPHAYEALGLGAGSGQAVAVALAAPKGVPGTQTKRPLLAGVTAQPLNVGLQGGKHTHRFMYRGGLNLGPLDLHYIHSHSKSCHP